MKEVGYFPFILITALLLISCSERRPYNSGTQKEKGIYGLVEKMEETTFYFREGMPPGKFYAKNTRIYSYNEKEQLVEELLRGYLLPDIRITYQFGEDDLLSGAVAYDSSNKVYWQAIFLYSDTAEEYTQEEKFFDPNKKLIGIYRAYYGQRDKPAIVQYFNRSEDRLLYSINYDSLEKPYEIINFYYNEDGLLYKDERTFPPDSQLITQEYTFDKNGNHANTTVHYENEDSYSSWTYTYEYDRFMNWEKRYLINDKRGFIKEITTRKFTYRH